MQNVNNINFSFGQTGSWSPLGSAEKYLFIKNHFFFLLNMVIWRLKNIVLLKFFRSVF